MTNETTYKVKNSERCVISGIFTEKELNRYAEAGWVVAKELNPGKPSKQSVEPWLVESAREILKAQGRLIDVKVEDIPEDELREKVENVTRSRAMRESGFSISQERHCSTRGSERSPVWDEVMKL